MATIKYGIRTFCGGEQATNISDFKNDTDSNNSRLSDELTRFIPSIHTNANVDRLEIVLYKQAANGA